jgi:DNA-binding IclR family transcriptional regulator
MLKTSPTDKRLSKIIDIPLKALSATLSSPASAERRDSGTRWALLHRVWDEFDEMPGTSLTLPQASRLFGVPAEVCDRILVGLVNDGRLRRTPDGRYRLRSFVA